jgi:hypothetical protein
VLGLHITASFSWFSERTGLLRVLGSIVAVLPCCGDVISLRGWVIDLQKEKKARNQRSERAETSNESQGDATEARVKIEVLC